jgi:hypothetical protein
MNWKEFFRITNRKLEITALLVIFYYIIEYATGYTFQLVIPQSSVITNTLMSCMQQFVGTSNLQFIISVIIMSMINFVILIIIYYFLSCEIVRIFNKRGRK